MSAIVAMIGGMLLCLGLSAGAVRLVVQAVPRRIR